MSDTRTIKILKSTVCDGLTVSPGDVVDASLSDARYLVNTKAAKPYVAPPKVERKIKNKVIATDKLEVRG